MQLALPFLGNRSALHSRVLGSLLGYNRLLCRTAGYQQDLLKGAHTLSVSTREARIINETKLQSWTSL